MKKQQCEKSFESMSYSDVNRDQIKRFEDKSRVYLFWKAFLEKFALALTNYDAKFCFLLYLAYLKTFEERLKKKYFIHSYNEMESLLNL